ncbi:A/G-specific adenine glycosylase, partial [Enterococcus lactis]|nr:A/G-specific adenine glycosylase [Enterococcus lactis]
MIQWNEQEKRNLTWSYNRNPYRIWISEIMLQQTRVDTVIDYFYSFMEWFPTIEELATAPEEKLLKTWEGLVYYSRAR